MMHKRMSFITRRLARVERLSHRHRPEALDYHRGRSQFDNSSAPIRILIQTQTNAARVLSPSRRSTQLHRMFPVIIATHHHAIVFEMDQMSAPLASAAKEIPAAR